MRAFVVAVVVIASACGNKKDAPTPAGASSSATASGSGSAAGSAACNDAEIMQRMDASFVVINRYFGEIAKRVDKWQDCEVARKDLLALEPEANAYVDEVTRTKSWGESLPEVCRERAKQLGETHVEGMKVQERFAPLEGQVKDALVRCQHHPGFQEAATKGLRVLRKKSTQP